MCLPCVPAVFGLADVIGVVLLCVLGGAAVVLWRGAQTLPFVVTGLWRYLSGARLFKTLRTRERDLPPRRLARHVHAVARTVLPTLALLALVYPYVGAFLLSLTAGTGVGAVLHAGRRHRELKAELKAEQARAIGEPIRVSAQIGVSS